MRVQNGTRNGTVKCKKVNRNYYACSNRTWNGTWNVKRSIETTMCVQMELEMAKRYAKRSIETNMRV